jgi:hypothetical protein
MSINMSSRTQTSSGNKSSRKRSILARGIALLVGGAFLAPAAHAATYYWDNNGTNPGYGTAGGTWAEPTIGDATQGWSTSNTGVLLPATITTLSTNATTDALNFGVATAGNGLGAGTITVSGTVQAGNMTFGSLSGVIVIRGGPSIAQPWRQTSRSIAPRKRSRSNRILPAGWPR